MRQTILLSAYIVALGALAALPALAAKPDKDKTPPVISTVAIAADTTTATVTWDTDEPADSDIDYGIDRLNKHGPRDTTLVLAHSIALAGLDASTTYQYCVVSRDESNNRAESCGHFDTQTSTTTPPQPPPPPPQPSSSGGGGGGSRPTLARASGLAYPNAHILVSLRALPFGGRQDIEVIADANGSFAAQFDRFLQGIYLFTVTAIDKNGLQSVAKRYQFDFFSGDAPLVADVVMPPTIALSQEVVALGDTLVVSGYTQPLQRVRIETSDISYETTADADGVYKVSINTARLMPGKIALRARAVGYDASPTKEFTLSATSVPEADLNKDSAVTIADISKFLASPVDLNKDGKVDAADMSIFLRAFVLIGL